MVALLAYNPKLYTFYLNLSYRYPFNTFVKLTFFIGAGRIRTNDGFPVDLQSTALTTQPLLPVYFY